MIELMQQYLGARGVDRRTGRAPLPKRIQAVITAGNTSTNARLGATTWAQMAEAIRRGFACRRWPGGLM